MGILQQPFFITVVKSVKRRCYCCEKRHRLSVLDLWDETQRITDPPPPPSIQHYYLIPYKLCAAIKVEIHDDKTYI